VNRSRTGTSLSATEYDEGRPRANETGPLPIHPFAKETSPLTVPSTLRPQRTTSRSEACRRAGIHLAAAVARRDALSVEDAARAAHTGTGGATLPDLERQIRARRTAPSLMREAS